MSDDSSKNRQLDLTDFGLGKWRAVLHEDSLLMRRCQRINTYSPDIKKLQNVPGVYLWLYQINADTYRFIHVGMTRRCLYARNTSHCRHQFSTDRVYAPTFGDGLGPFGRLGEDLRPALTASNPSKLESTAEDFLKNIRILHLIPEDVDVGRKATIRQLEGLIARHGSKLLNGKITNTLSSTSNIDTECSLTAEDLAARLNHIAHCLPSAVTTDEY